MRNGTGDETIRNSKAGSTSLEFNEPMTAGGRARAMA